LKERKPQNYQMLQPVNAAEIAAPDAAAFEPVADNFTNATTTQGQFKAALANMISFYNQFYLKSDRVITDYLADFAVTTDKLASHAVTTEKLDPSCVCPNATRAVNSDRVYDLTYAQLLKKLQDDMDAKLHAIYK